MWRGAETVMPFSPSKPERVPAAPSPLPPLQFGGRLLGLLSLYSRCPFISGAQCSSVLFPSTAAPSGGLGFPSFPCLWFSSLRGLCSEVQKLFGSPQFFCRRKCSVSRCRLGVFVEEASSGSSHIAVRARNSILLCTRRNRSSYCWT